MWRRVLCATFVIAVSFGMVVAEEYKGRITGYDAKANTITVKSKDFKDFKDGKTFDLDKDVKVFMIAKKDDPKEEVKGGAEAAFKKLPEKGLFAISIKTDDTSKKVTEITVTKGKKQQ